MVVMAAVFTGAAYIFFRFFVEFGFTAWAAEVIGVAFILRFVLSRFLIYFHSAYKVFYHLYYLLKGYYYTGIRRLYLLTSNASIRHFPFANQRKRTYTGQAVWRVFHYGRHTPAYDKCHLFCVTGHLALVL